MFQTATSFELVKRNLIFKDKDGNLIIELVNSWVNKKIERSKQSDWICLLSILLAYNINIFQWDKIETKVGKPWLTSKQNNRICCESPRSINLRMQNAFQYLLLLSTKAKAWKYLHPSQGRPPTHVNSCKAEYNKMDMLLKFSMTNIKLKVPPIYILNPSFTRVEIIFLISW
jgi:hypothetical protein